MRRNALISICLLLMGCARHYDVKFINSPTIKPYHKFDFKLAEQFNVQIQTRSPRTRRVVSIRKGFVTDLASVPRLMWACYSPNDSRTIPAAILHDYLYRYKLDFTRKEVDDIFYFALLRGNTKPRTALKYYIGVRLFGWIFYQKRKQ